MKYRDYLVGVRRTECTYKNKEDRITHAAMGLVTESAEFLDMLKKHIFYGKEFDRINAIEEIGDLMYYIAMSLDYIESDLSEALEANQRKLKIRYPRKFSQNEALNRKLDRELKALKKGEK